MLHNRFHIRSHVTAVINMAAM